VSGVGHQCGENRREQRDGASRLIVRGLIEPYMARAPVLDRPGAMRTYITFGDIKDKLDVLRVECTRCQRKGRYIVAKLIEKYGPEAI